MKRERIDKTMSLKVIKRVIRPFVLKTLAGGTWLATPTWGNTTMKDKSISVTGLWATRCTATSDTGTSVKFEGITYKDGEKIEGKTTSVEIRSPHGLVPENRQS